MATKRGLAPWSSPINEDSPKLYLYNSLTRKKEEFVPQSGNKVLWYSCGPTVYDHSHMGHARSYISFDIMRRLLQDYFKYDVTYCMNVTDIDDKIIRKARQDKLFRDYCQETRENPELLLNVTEAVGLIKEKLAKEEEEAKKKMLTVMIEKSEAVAQSLAEAISAGTATNIKTAKNLLLENAKDPLSAWLDGKYGASVTDNSIFYDLPRRFEGEYHKDMAALNVLPPDVLTRVTEFVPEVVEFVEKIISNGFAYEANGSVYFDTVKFSQDKNHYYAKLVPEAFGDAKALQEGEGDLSSTSGEKRSANDFALWKFSKPGEPGWDSPWGKGRPGWHIECSVMASVTLGDSIDIHTGGTDLKFPHHDNELAQAEAHYGHSHWIHYFLHSGHLNIDGMKMSKSLKNFTTIQNALKEHTARQIRFAFLLHSWKDTLDYSETTMAIAKSFETTFNEFFLRVKSELHNLPTTGTEMFRKWSHLEVSLDTKFSDGKSAVHKCLCDSLDTRGAMEKMKELVSAANVYLGEISSQHKISDYILLKNIGLYLTNMFKIFGAVPQDMMIGFPQEGAGGQVNIEEAVMPYLDCIAEFRRGIRELAAESSDKESLKLCDELRDERLPNLGVRLEDKDGKAVIKLVGKEALMKEREEKKLAMEKERLLKEERKRKQDAEKALRDKQKMIDPAKMFLSETDKYSKFDEKGLPTHDVNGEEITKSMKKKLQKQYDTQAKKFNSNSSGAAA